MKRFLALFFCLALLCCFMSSCSARMNRPLLPLPSDGVEDQDGVWEWNTDHQTQNDMEQDRDYNSGEYHAGSNGRVRGHSSDNDFSI